jgi:uncharacterized protein (TIGR00299 family) protein
MIAWLDASSGVSGDKFLGALIDAGADLAAVQAAIDAVLPGGAELLVEPAVRGGIAGKHVTVVAAGDQPRRTWRAIRELLASSVLDEPVRDRALAVFGELAAAEAAVHGVDVEDVHFHEVGAVDSIADIVGGCAALDVLAIDELVCSPVSVGSGTVATQHGVLPVPSPATLALLVGIPSQAGDATSEMTTPTGAALVRVLADRYGPMPPMTPASVGHGAGLRELEIPNVLRIVVGEREANAESGPRHESVTVLRSVIDHRSPEHVAFAVELLREAGALDAWVTPVVMKKGRPGVEVTILAAPEQAELLAGLLARHTGTLGVRFEETTRLVAERSSITVLTPFGEVRLKVGPDGTSRPEHDDCARIARRHDMTLADVEEIVASSRASAEDEPGKDH